MAQYGFDYIIIGAGTAGCVLANRLTEDPDIRVAILEAGGPDSDSWIHIPLGFGRIHKARAHDWGYFTEPEPHLNDREVEVARGRVLGGSSSINATGHIRAHPGDFERWEKSGLTGWGWADMLPYHKKSEAWEEGETVLRGGSGPITVRRSRFPDPINQAYLQAAEAAGYPVNDDHNGPRQEGFSLMQSAIRDGKRCSAAVGYLRPALARPNLTAVTGALVRRILIEKGPGGTQRAVGVRFQSAGNIREFRAEREVIVAGGAINSPQILMLSGIGPADHLREHGIAVIHDSPGVGENLQDHPVIPLVVRRKEPGPFHASMRADKAALNLARAWFLGTGPATDLPSGLIGWVRSEADQTLPEVQFLFFAATPAAEPWFPGIWKPWEDGFILRPVVLRPEARGWVRLASADPTAKPRIRINLLGTERDRRLLRDGLRIARDLTSRPSMDAFRGAELMPGKDVTTDAQIDAYARATCITAHHPCCSVPMGADPAAPVDESLRLRGVDGLRVVDASVMPDLVGANINVTVMAIAEKAADMIKGTAPAFQEAAAAH